MTIKEILASLDQDLYDEIWIAFEEGTAKFVEYKPGQFLGVNLTGQEHNLKTDQVAGLWSCGEITR